MEELIAFVVAVDTFVPSTFSWWSFFKTIYAGNYRLRFSLKILNGYVWCFTFQLPFHTRNCLLPKHLANVSVKITDKVRQAHPVLYSRPIDVVWWSGTGLRKKKPHEHDKPFCGRPRKPRPLISTCLPRFFLSVAYHATAGLTSRSVSCQSPSNKVTKTRAAQWYSLGTLQSSHKHHAYLRDEVRWRVLFEFSMQTQHTYLPFMQFLKTPTLHSSPYICE